MEYRVENLLVTGGVIYSFGLPQYFLFIQRHFFGLLVLKHRHLVIKMRRAGVGRSATDTPRTGFDSM
jgi:hypothetical protein